MSDQPSLSPEALADAFLDAWESQLLLWLHHEKTIALLIDTLLTLPPPTSNS